jgi:hypothetical protein
MMASSWFSALDTRHQLMVQVYGLAELAELPVNAESLMAEAVCFDCLTEKQLLQVEVRELCELISAD